MKKIFNSKISLALCLFLLSSSCQKEEEAVKVASTTSRSLYVTSGSCYSGNGITTFSALTASNLVMKINTLTGERESVIADYNRAPYSTGDTPVSVVDWDQDHLLVLIANGTGGRIEVQPKSGASPSNFGLNPGPGTILSTALRGMIKAPDGGLLILRTGFVERVSTSGVRVGAPWVNSVLPAPCGTSALLTSVIVSPTSNRLVTTNAVNTTNRLVSIAATGGTATAGCSAIQAAPVVASGSTAFPTASVFHSSSGKLIVAYAASNTLAEANSIYAYDFNESTGAISNGQKIYDAALYPATYNYLLYGISAMTLDPETDELYVATAISNAATAVNYAIEKFRLDASKIGTDNPAVLNRVGATPFYTYGIDTKCISSLTVGN